MEKYKKIAEEFYEAFEGLQLYPKLLSWQWILWFLTVIAAVLCVSNFKAYPEGIPMRFFLPTLLMTVAATLGIDNFKAKALKMSFASYPSIDAARVSKIKELLGKAPCEFSEAAQELMQLIELSKKCGAQPLQTRELFPIPWEKGQFVMHALTLAGLIFTTLGVLFPDTAKQIGQQIDSKMIGQFLGLTFVVIFASLTAYPMLRSMWHRAERGLRFWQARVQKKGPVRTAVHLDYLLSALVDLHEPHPASIKRRIRRFTPSSVRHRKQR